MKKIFGVSVAIALLAMPFISSASEFRAGDQPSVGANEHTVGNMYIAGKTITSAGSIPGDITAAGANVIISGPVGGDVLSAGGNVTILSSVGGDIRTAGGDVVIQGTVKGDVLVAGGQITIGGAGVGGDAAMAGGTVHIDAPISGNLKVGGRNVTINAPVSGAVTIDADTVTLGASAVIRGNMTYTATTELTKKAGAQTLGKVEFTKRALRGDPAASVPVMIFGKFITLLVLALIVGLSLRRYSKDLVKKATERPMRELGRGLLVFVSMPIVSILLFVTLVGTPLGVVGLMGFMILLIFSWIVSPIIVGSVVYSYFSKHDEVSWQTIFVGTIIYALLLAIPVIGWIISCLITLLSLGAITAIKTDVIREWK